MSNQPGGYEPRRVVVTGLGAITSLGLTIDRFWGNILAGRSGVCGITAFDPAQFDTKFAAQINDFDSENYMDRKDAKRMDRYVQLAVGAAREAVKDACLEITPENCDRVGVYIGSGVGGLLTMETQTQILIDRGPQRLSPFLIPMMIADMGSGLVSILLGARGPNSTVVTACATGTHAVGDAYEIIRRGDADAMIAGGAEAAITQLGVGGFNACRALSTRNDDPEGASRPFDATRDGFVLGEGAGILILEELEIARARNARIYAEVIGYGMSGDAYHITAPAPEGEGASRAMAMALKKAGIRPDEIDYVNAHGTSTIPNDRLETAAVKRTYGDHAYKLAMSSTKSMTGHLLGAAGAVEALICCLAIRDQVAPPTINYTTPDPECDLDYVPNQARKMPIRTTMSNSFGFGGHNATIALRAI